MFFSSPRTRCPYHIPLRGVRGRLSSLPWILTAGTLSNSERRPLFPEAVQANNDVLVSISVVFLWVMKHCTFVSDSLMLNQMQHVIWKLAWKWLYSLISITIVGMQVFIEKRLENQFIALTHIVAENGTSLTSYSHKSEEKIKSREEALHLDSLTERLIKMTGDVRGCRAQTDWHPGLKAVHTGGCEHPLKQHLSSHKLFPSESLSTFLHVP